MDTGRPWLAGGGICLAVFVSAAVLGGSFANLRRRGKRTQPLTFTPLNSESTEDVAESPLMCCERVLPLRSRRFSLILRALFL